MLSVVAAIFFSVSSTFSLRSLIPLSTERANVVMEPTCLTKAKHAKENAKPVTPQITSIGFMLCLLGGAGGALRKCASATGMAIERRS
ncbi:hypothetical protein M758_UG056100 [Ceratodon purpureus]|nr:hypothetical protein M758_UG056100 [Ceratodon purpureus]